MKKIKNNPLIIIIAILSVTWGVVVFNGLQSIRQEKRIDKVVHTNKELKDKADRLERVNQDVGHQLNEKIQYDREGAE